MALMAYRWRIGDVCSVLNPSGHGNQTLLPGRSHGVGGDPNVHTGRVHYHTRTLQPRAHPASSCSCVCRIHMTPTEGPPRSYIVKDTEIYVPEKIPDDANADADADGDENCGYDGLGACAA